MVSTRRAATQQEGNGLEHAGEPASQEEPSTSAHAEQAPNTKQKVSSGKQHSSSQEAAAYLEGGGQPSEVENGQPSQPAQGAEAAGVPDPAPLDMFSEQPDEAAALENLLKAVQDPTVFLQPSQHLSQAARQAARVLHHHGAHALLGTAGKHKKEKAELLSSLGGGKQQQFLPELCVDAAFDAEQIWMQMDLATTAALKRARHMLPSAHALLKAEGHLLKPEHEAAVDAILAGSRGESSEEEGEGDSGSGDEDDLEEGPSKRQKRSGGESGSGYDDDDDIDEDEMEALLNGEGRDDFDDDDGDEEELFGSGGGREQSEEGGKGRRGGTKAPATQEKLLPTEDQFMRLSEMDAFLQDAEQQDARRRQKQQNEDQEDRQEDEEGDMDEDEEDALLFGSDEEEGQGFDEDMSSGGRKGKKKASKKGKSAGDAMYADFFGDDGRGDRAFWGADDGGAVPRGGPASSRRKGPMDMEDLEDAPFAVHAGGFEDQDEMDEDEGGSSEGDEEGSSGSGSDGEGREDQAGRKGSSGGPDTANLSTHEKRQLRVQERVRELEAEAMAEKEWHLRGEVAAGHRPLNSALEVDVDFDTTVKPPPEPTEEAMADIEALIKRRIADHQFDDVVRVLPPPPERKRREIDLDDNKASKGLGEVYEEQYVKNVVGNTSEDKDEKVRNEARMLFQALVGKLDALTHFHFAPKPVVEDLNVRSDVAAVVMEEAAPVAVGNAAANMQLPGEVFRPQDAGAPKAEGEMTREDRKRQRAQHKQASKAAREQKEAERNARAAALGQKMPLPSDSTLPAPVAGRKSAALAAATGGKKGAKAAAKAAAAALGQGALKHGKTEFGRSGAVFAKLQQEQDMARANGGQLPKKKGHQQLGQDGGKPALAAAFLKL